MGRRSCELAVGLFILFTKLQWPIGGVCLLQGSSTHVIEFRL